MAYTTIDCCPVDTRLYPDLKAIKDATGCVYQSIYRGQDPAAQQFLTGSPPCFKHNQAWIFANFPPGVANPPGYSTHECRNDGVAYTQWLRGAPIPWWCCGIDVDDAHVAAVCTAARGHGWIVTVTYPGSAVEYHHVNFRQQPMIVHLIPTLKRGDHGIRVRRLTRKLAYVREPGTNRHYLANPTADFNQAVESAVKRFQGDHHQTADGVVGPHTRAQLRVSVRRERKLREVEHLRGNLRDIEGQLKEVRDRADRLRKELEKLGPNQDDARKRLQRDLAATKARIADLEHHAERLRTQIRKLGFDPHPKP